MNTEDRPMDERERLREASEWWLSLQDAPSAEQTAAWVAWSQKDSANLDAFDRIDSMALELRRLHSKQRTELMREFAPEQSQSPPQPRAQGRIIDLFSFRRPSWVAAAATLAVIVLGLIYINQNTPGETTYSTERALHQNVTLVDGSHVTVGASSELAVRMREDARLVHLHNGEAYFDVQKDPKRPFIVDAGAVTVTAVGTAFDVRRTGESVAVSVTEGRVRVERPAGGPMNVAAGERVAYEPKSRSFKLSKVTPERAAAWRERRLEFVNEPLDVVIANVNRYASPPISIEPAAASLTFTGTVSPENLGSWLNALPSVLPVQVDQGKDEVLISKP